MIGLLDSLDRSLFLFLNGLNTRWLNPVMQVFSGQLIWAVFLGYAFWNAYQKRSKRFFWTFTLFMLMTLIASDVSSSYLIKNIFDRLRPCRVAELKPLIQQFGQKCGGKYGFVSSHAANTMALIVFCRYSLDLHSSWTKFLFLAPILVGLSRIYLGVHYPGDIIGGWLVGLCWGALLVTCFKNSRSETA